MSNNIIHLQADVDSERAITTTKKISYYQKNKDELKKKIKCDDCGHEYMKYNKTSHIRTKKHLNSLKNIESKNDSEALKKLQQDLENQKDLLANQKTLIDYQKSLLDIIISAKKNNV